MLKNIEFKNHNVLIIGFAMTGKSVAEFLLKQGASVTINDRGDLSQDPSVNLLLTQGARVVTGSHPVELLDQSFDYIVKNPGIPYSIEIIQEAIRLKIPVYTDVELASWISEAPIIGVTGSNGKTTTTSLIHQFLTHRQTGQAYLAGNIGIPSLEVASLAQEEDDIIIELSSFQLMGIETLRPRIAVICNIYEAHLDYHGNREAYIQAKLNLVSNLSSSEQLVYNYDQPELSEWLKDNPAQKVPFATRSIDDFVRREGAYLEFDRLFFRGEAVASLEDIQIPGIHNVENVLAAIAVAKLKGIDNSSIQSALRQFTGVAHRIQPIGQLEGRQFYNDSKATNMTATITALKSFETPIVYIGGGLDRGNEFDELIPYLGQVKAAFLYGETKQKMANAFKQADVPEVIVYEELSEATKAAYRFAERGDTVLLSPSCASWDQFKTFEVRGQLFVDVIRNLIASEPYLD